jgi:hypothetical protein
MGRISIAVAVMAFTASLVSGAGQWTTREAGVAKNAPASN